MTRQVEMTTQAPTVISVGTRIKFKQEKRPYRVQAVSPRYVICTKPFNLSHTVLYTIIDFKEQVRGTENLIFCMGFETRRDCQEALARLLAEKSEVSHRNRIELDIEEILPPT